MSQYKPSQITVDNNGVIQIQTYEQAQNAPISEQELDELTNTAIISENSPEHIATEMGKSFEQQGKQAQIQNQQALEQVQQQINTGVNNSILPMIYGLAGFFLVLSLAVVFIKTLTSDKDK